MASTARSTRPPGRSCWKACRELGGCATGDAKATAGFRLPARVVIHTVGPIWRGGGHGEAELLAACYRRSLELAVEHEVASLAFPCISTGVYGYPPEPAARIAIETVRAFGEASQGRLCDVTFCCFSADALEVYQRLLSAR